MVVAAGADGGGASPFLRGAEVRVQRIGGITHTVQEGGAKGGEGARGVANSSSSRSTQPLKEQWVGVATVIL